MVHWLGQTFYKFWNIVLLFVQVRFLPNKSVFFLKKFLCTLYWLNQFVEIHWSTFSYYNHFSIYFLGLVRLVGLSVFPCPLKTICICALQLLNRLLQLDKKCQPALLFKFAACYLKTYCYCQQVRKLVFLCVGELYSPSPMWCLMKSCLLVSW